jgi:polyhydroxyalkanoate synthesis regulator phasin
MMDLLHKILYTGIGIAALTEEKAKELAADLEKRGEVSGEEGKQLAQDLIAKAKKHSQDLRETIGEEVNKVLSKMKLVSRSEYEELCQRIAHLEDKCTESHPEESATEDSL